MNFDITENKLALNNEFVYIRVKVHSGNLLGQKRLALRAAVYDGTQPLYRSLRLYHQKGKFYHTYLPTVRNKKSVRVRALFINQSGPQHRPKVIKKDKS